MSHGAVDEDHLQSLEQLLNGMTDPADRTAILTMARETFTLFAGVFAALPLDHAHEHA
jgi:hypothetical protein